jgi:coenzyme F420-reducing hydrogenase alpha subunit
VPEDYESESLADLGGQKVRLYPVTRIHGRADIEVLFDPDHKVTEARFRGLESRGMEDLVTSVPALRAPEVLGRTCGTCGTFHQLASCLAIEAACGTEVPEASSSARELVCWLLMAASHLSTILFLSLPDFALPTSDAAVKNIKGIYMIDQESITRLSHAMSSMNEALRCLAGGSARPAMIVPGGVSRLPDDAAVSRAAELLADCEDDLRETMRLAEMLTRREARMMETGDPLKGYFVASTAEGLPAIVADEMTIKPFAGGEGMTMDPDSFLDSIEERPVPWSRLVPVAVRGLEPCMVGPLARLNIGYGEDTPLADLECRRIAEQWDYPLDREMFSLMALACESIWAWEKASNLLAGSDLSGSKPCAPVQLEQSDGFAVVDGPNGTIVHALSMGGDGLVESYRLYSPLQFSYLLINEHLTGVAEDTVRGIEISDAVAARLQLAVRSFNPCVPCGTH